MNEWIDFKLFEPSIGSWIEVEYQNPIRFNMTGRVIRLPQPPSIVQAHTKSLDPLDKNGKKGSWRLTSKNVLRWRLAGDQLDLEDNNIKVTKVSHLRIKK